MPSKAKSNTITLSRIALHYRIYFLYIEPIMALAGAYICVFQPDRYVSGTVPFPAYIAAPIPITPVFQMMLTNIGALYLLFSMLGGILLRLTREKNVWLATLAGMLMSDVGHIYAAYAVAPERILQVGAWTSEEWINYGTLILGASLRAGFLVGIGRP